MKLGLKPKSSGAKPSTQLGPAASPGLSRLLHQHTHLGGQREKMPGWLKVGIGDTTRVTGHHQGWKRWAAGAGPYSGDLQSVSHASPDPGITLVMSAAPSASFLSVKLQGWLWVCAFSSHGTERLPLPSVTGSGFPGKSSLVWLNNCAPVPFHDSL